METKQFGQGMMAAGSVVALTLLTLYFSSVEQKQFNPNQNPNSLSDNEGASVELIRNKFGHYVVTGEINNQEVEFLLDTGATDVVIPENTAKELGLNRGQASRAYTANGTVTVYNTNIAKLTIGNISLYDVRASINPGMDRSSILLGMSALKQVEFLQQGNSLTLRQIY